MEEKDYDNGKDISEPLPEKVYSEVSPVSPFGTSLFESKYPITSENIDEFISDKELVHKSIKRLREKGFEVLSTNYITINISASPSLYESVFKTTLVTKERPAMKHLGLESTTTIIDTSDTDIEGYIDTSKSDLNDLLEGGAINRKIYFLSSYLPPNVPYWNLNPSNMSVAMNADKAHTDWNYGKRY